jgi:hypothetical protein
MGGRRLLIAMRVSLLLSLSFLYSLVAVVPSESSAAEPDADYVEGQLLVTFRQGVHVETQSSVHRVNEALVIDRFRGLRTDLVELPRDVSVPAAAAAYQQRADVLTAEPNFLRRPDTVVANDPEMTNQWPLLNTGQTVNDRRHCRYRCSDKPSGSRSQHLDESR